jgi:hypothetical protein
MGAMAVMMEARLCHFESKADVNAASKPSLCEQEGRMNETRNFDYGCKISDMKKQAVMKEAIRLP